jgi:hypothetical protein
VYSSVTFSYPVAVLVAGCGAIEQALSIHPADLHVVARRQAIIDFLGVQRRALIWEWEQGT